MSVTQVKLCLSLPSLLILQLILVDIRMAENDKDDNGGVKKRILKCSGCKVKFADHGLGKLGPYCEGYHTGAEKKVK